MYVRTWYFNLNIALKKYTSIDLKDEIRVTMKYIRTWLEQWSKAL